MTKNNKYNDSDLGLVILNPLVWLMIAFPILMIFSPPAYHYENQGYRAAASGEPITSNPYIKPTSERNAWLNGYSWYIEQQKKLKQEEENLTKKIEKNRK